MVGFNLRITSEFSKMPYVRTFLKVERSRMTL